MPTQPVIPFLQCERKIPGVQRWKNLLRYIQFNRWSKVVWVSPAKNEEFFQCCPSASRCLALSRKAGFIMHNGYFGRQITLNVLLLSSSFTAEHDVIQRGISFHYLRGAYKQDGDWLFTWAVSVFWFQKMNQGNKWTGINPDQIEGLQEEGGGGAGWLVG